MIYFVSDLHFGHGNIIKYEEEFRGRYRTVEEMNEDLIRQWNKLIGRGDTVYNLGDFFFNLKRDKVEGILKRLNYKNMVFLVGNHDSNRDLNVFKEYGIEVKYADLIKVNGYKLYLSHYPTILGIKYMYNLHGHLHSNEVDSNYHINVGCDSLLKIGISLYEVLSKVEYLETLKNN